MTGSARVAKAAPDGYQFVLGNLGTHAANQTFYKNPLYNAATDFAPVALIAEMPFVLVARKDLPPGNLAEFTAYAQANQAKMQYGSGGSGSATHLACVLLTHQKPNYERLATLSGLTVKQVSALTYQAADQRHTPHVGSRHGAHL